MPPAPDLLRWLARIESPDGRPVGAGFLVDGWHVLTCAHVVLAASGGVDPRDGGIAVRVSFPHLDTGAIEATVVLDAWRSHHDDERGDFAVLRLITPPPDGAAPAPLRTPHRLRDDTFSTQGFPAGDPDGVGAVGVLRGREGPGSRWLRIEDTKEQGRAVEYGFSGSPVWDDRVGAVVAMVVAKDRRTGAKAAYAVPLQELTHAWPRLALLAASAADPAELRSHWEPRARGERRLTSTSGWYFTGRRRAMRELVASLDSSAAGKGRFQVVTGGPGSGKSSVLARLVTLADVRLRERIPLPDPDPAPLVGSIDAAVHARGHTLDEIVVAVADRLGVDATDAAELVDSLLERGKQFVLIVDALDETVGGGADVVRALLRPLATHGGAVGASVLVGTRRRLLPLLTGYTVIDLDDPAYLDEADLRDYAARRLTLDGGPDTPYRRDRPLAKRVAAAVAARAHPSFLVTQLVCTTLARDPMPVDVTTAEWSVRFPSEVSAAMDEYVAGFGDDAGWVRDLLRPLAHAEGPGLRPDALWAELANRLAGRTGYRLDDVTALLASAAGSLLSHGADGSVRLFHLALAEHIRDTDSLSDAQERITSALRESTPALDGHPAWHNAHQYTREHLAQHAAYAGRLRELLDDPGFVLAAEPRGLASAVRGMPADTIRTVVLHALEVISDARARDRAAHLALAARTAGVEQAIDCSDCGWRPGWVYWSDVAQGDLVLRLGSAVRGLAVGRDSWGGPRLMAAERSGRVVSIDPARATVRWEVELDTPVRDIVESSEGKGLVAVLDGGGLAGIDADTGEVCLRFTHPEPNVTAIASLRDGDRWTVVTGTYNEGPTPFDDQTLWRGVVRSWTVHPGHVVTERWARYVFGSGVRTLALIEHNGLPAVLAAGDRYGEEDADARTVRLLDLGDGRTVASMPHEPQAWRASATPVPGGRVLAGTDATLTSWDPAGGTAVHHPPPGGSGPPDRITVVRHRNQLRTLLLVGRELVVAGGETPAQLSVPGVAPLPGTRLACNDGSTDAGPATVVTGDPEGNVRIWDLDQLAGPRPATRVRIEAGAIDERRGVAYLAVDDGTGAMEVRDLVTGEQLDRRPNLWASQVAIDPDCGVLLLQNLLGLSAYRLPDLTLAWREPGDVQDFCVHEGLVACAVDNGVLLLDLYTGLPRGAPGRIVKWGSKAVIKVLLLREMGGVTVVAGGPSAGLGDCALRDLDSARKRLLSRTVTVPHSGHATPHRIAAGKSDVLAVVRERSPDVQLFGPHTPAGGRPETIWRAHDHGITALGQRGRQVWTADSWGVVRVWDATHVPNVPTLLREIRLSSEVTMLHPLQAPAVLIGTDRGALRLDLQRPLAGSGAS